MSSDCFIITRKDKTLAVTAQWTGIIFTIIILFAPYKQFQVISEADYYFICLSRLLALIIKYQGELIRAVCDPQTILTCQHHLNANIPAGQYWLLYCRLVALNSRILLPCFTITYAVWKTYSFIIKSYHCTSG